MKKLAPVHFNAHAQVKSIVGQDMIDDDNIAIKELVKNGIDAQASEVSISFEYANDTLKKITISDNGIGMSNDDLEKKWLNLGYSSKKGDTTRNFAGNKGIGRFSADRLGGRLQLFTKTQEDKDFLLVDVDWGEFENKSNWSDRIENVSFDRFILSPAEAEEKSSTKDISTGTYLVITEPRFNWDEVKLKDLKSDLEKLMIPEQIEGANDFKLTLNVTGISLDNDGICGEVKNKIFETLPFKTSYVTSETINNGDDIKTNLYHQGELLVSIIEKNKFYVRDCKITLHYLNPYHKAYFKRVTDIRSVNYGSIFLYLNGFRVKPYGDVGNDWLGVDRRHGQGHSRYLGLRDLLGHIAISDKEGEFFKVASDREGLRRNKEFLELKDINEGYLGHVMKKLERFVVEGLSWDSSEESVTEIEKRLDLYDGELLDFKTNYRQDRKTKESQLVNALDSIILFNSRHEDIKNINFGSKALEVLQKQERESLDKLQKKLKKFQLNLDDGQEVKSIASISSAISKANKKISTLKKKNETLEKQLDKVNKEKEKAVKEIAKVKVEVEEKRSQNMFLTSALNADVTNIMSLHHHIGISASTIDSYIKNVTKKIKKGDQISNEKLLDIFEKISFESRKITTTTNFATKANFNLNATAVKGDICEYISEYLMNVSNGLVRTKDNKRDMKFSYSNKANVKFKTEYRPLELSIVLDNLINNSRKAEAKSISVSIDVVGETLTINYKDDGHGIAKDKQAEIFNIGYTTTNGSGLGLYQVRKTLEDMGGSIHLETSSKSGAKFRLEFER